MTDLGSKLLVFDLLEFLHIFLDPIQLLGDSVLSRTHSLGLQVNYSDQWLLLREVQGPTVTAVRFIMSNNHFCKKYRDQQRLLWEIHCISHAKGSRISGKVHKPKPASSISFWLSISEDWTAYSNTRLYANANAMLIGYLFDFFCLPRVDGLLDIYGPYGYK